MAPRNKRLKPNVFKKDITPYEVPNPYRYDIVVKSLQLALKELSWLKSFAAAQIRQTKDENGSRLTRPYIFVQEDKDFNALLLQDNFPAYSFWYVDGEEKPINYSISTANTYQVDLCGIFWMNQNLVDPARKDDFFNEYVQQTIDAIKNSTNISGPNKSLVRDIQDVRVIYDRDEVLRDFTLDQTETKYTDYPYRMWKICLTGVFTEHQPGC